MLALASQITLIYYITLFVAAIRLRYLPAESSGYRIPGGNSVMWLLMGIGIFTSLLALLSGFIPPANLNEHEIFLFHLIMTGGIAASICLPFLFFICGENRKSRNA